ncbi:MAG: hypothetical protein KGI79_01425 [Patescibacteria group bacterium]|nr:hypothetical protein [Patescibacteria group bacterium]MDE2116518.1 hypothetical protein [Patescibacteria group bacterium]
MNFFEVISIVCLVVAFMFVCLVSLSQICYLNECRWNKYQPNWYRSRLWVIGLFTIFEAAFVFLAGVALLTERIIPHFSLWWADGLRTAVVLGGLALILCRAFERLDRAVRTA